MPAGMKPSVQKCLEEMEPFWKNHNTGVRNLNHHHICSEKQRKSINCSHFKPLFFSQIMNWSPLWRRICCHWMRSRRLPLGWSGFSKNWPSCAWLYPRMTLSLQLRMNGWPSALSSTSSCSASTCLFWSCMLVLCCHSGPDGALPDHTIRDIMIFPILWVKAFPTCCI